jgi:hypothetical protein
MDILQARAGDTLVTVAARFETTLKKLLSVNPHIMKEDELFVGEKNSNNHACYRQLPCVRC